MAKGAATIARPSSEANADKKPTANMSNSDCASLPLSSDERADIRSRVEALPKRSMERSAAAPLGEDAAAERAAGSPRADLENS